MQKCIIKAALLGLSIAIIEPTMALASSIRQQSRIEATRSDAQVGSARNALTQETRVNHSRNVVNQPYMARASWYRHGSITANGERYNPRGLTVAHRSLPFNTILKFTDPETGASVIARVNDRGPFIRGREFDLSMGAAQLLGIIDRGVVKLVVEIVQENN